MPHECYEPDVVILRTLHSLDTLIYPSFSCIRRSYKSIISTTLTMALHRESRESSSEAAEPLYRDSSEQTEKPSQHEGNTHDELRTLHASIRRLRRWLIAVSILFGLACAYILFSFRGVVRDHVGNKRLSFGPESKASHEIHPMKQ